MEDSRAKETFVGRLSEALSIPPAGIVECLLALNIFLSITAFLGNVLILIALHRVISIYPPTKLFFRCLAVTDLCVGLIVQPLYVYATYTMFRAKEINAGVLYRVYNICGVVSMILAGVSVLSSTAISVDRLLVLLLEMRYRHVVTLGRVRVVLICFWLIGASTVPMWLWEKGLFYKASSFIVVLCLITSISCYVKISLTLWQHQAQIHVQNHFHREHTNEGGIPLNIARYKKTVSSILWVQLALVACYVPYAIVAGTGINNGVVWLATANLV